MRVPSNSTTGEPVASIAVCRSSSSEKSIRPAIVRVRLVKLQHRELGIVVRGEPFVAEVAVDLVDALQPAHHQPLQIQLRRDAQVQIDVQRVVVRDERTRRRAAVERLHHRRLHFDEAARFQLPAQRRDDARPRDEHLAHFRDSRSGPGSAAGSGSPHLPGRATSPAWRAASWRGTPASRRECSVRPCACGRDSLPRR